MKGDIKKGFYLMLHGISVKTNVALMLCFFVLGLCAEFLVSTDVWGGSAGNMGYDPGAVFLFCALMFPGQMVISLDMSALAQTSPYKRKLQTAIPAVMAGAGSLFSLTLIVVIRLAGVLLMGGDPAMLQEIFKLGILDAFLIIYFGFVYKYFIPSIIVLYLVMILNGALPRDIVWPAALGNAFAMPPALCILFAYAVVIMAVFVQYWIARALYRREFSKWAFGACMRRRA